MPVSATKSQRTTAPSTPPEANLVPWSIAIDRTGVVCPFSTSGSGSSLPFSTSRECTRLVASVISKTRTPPSTHPVAILDPATTRQTTSSLFKALPEPTPPVSNSACPSLNSGVNWRRLMPRMCDPAIVMRGAFGWELKKASIEFEGGALDDAAAVVKPNASAHSYRRYV